MDESETRAVLLTLAMRRKVLRARTRVWFAVDLAERWEPEVNESVEESMLRVGWNWDAPRRPARADLLDLRRFIERGARACGFEYNAVFQPLRSRFTPQDATRWAAIVAAEEIGVDDLNAVLDPRRLGDFAFTSAHWRALGTALERFPPHRFLESENAMLCADCHVLQTVWCEVCEACCACAKLPWGRFCDLQPDRTNPC